MTKPDRYAEAKEQIHHIFHENKGRYGYRRITMEMHNRGYLINHKQCNDNEEQIVDLPAPFAEQSPILKKE
jgi:hypothetical protein